MVMNTLGQRETPSERQALIEKAIAQIRVLVDQGRLGRKSGQGFYRWEKDNAVKHPDKQAGQDLQSIADRLINAYTTECIAALADQIVADADLLDAGMVFGTGFAPFRGGPMHYLDRRDVQIDTTATQRGNPHD